MINESVKRTVFDLGIILEGPSGGALAGHEHLQDAHDAISSHVAENKRRGKNVIHYEQMLKTIRELQQRIKDDK